MDRESLYKQFVCLIFTFLGSILLLVVSNTLLSLFVAWDLLGFTSLYLVFFYRSRSSLAGGLLTGLTNRLGDAILLTAFGLSGVLSFSSHSLFLFTLFFVAFTKSAQVPFSSWLPAAMLAPTPVSALVHSSTLVTAGVYLLYRYAFLSSSFLMWVGIFTTLYAGFSCILETDIKKVIALSTLSQLGIMICSLGLGSRGLAFAHLNIHASFKALLFLSVGTLIHVSYGSQESRVSLSLITLSPFVLIFSLIGRLSMCGFVFLSGCVSKEPLLEACYNSSISLMYLLSFYLGIGLTVIYSFRLRCQFLGSSLTHTVSVQSLPLTFSSLAPMAWLSFNGVVQGSVWSSLSTTLASTLSVLDKLFIIVVFLLFASAASSLVGHPSSIVSPSVFLTRCTRLFGSFSVPASSVYRTEVVLRTGGGLAGFPSLFSGFKPGAHFFVRNVVFLSLCFVLL